MTDQSEPDNTRYNSQDIHDLATLQSALYNFIPISKHMGINADSYDGERLVLSAPLANNINHQLSAFGGSLFSVSALAGWSILQLKLAEMKVEANTVIAGGDVSYSHPVFETLHCEIELPDAYPAFRDKFLETGKASILLTSNIMLDGQSAMAFSGKYVVRKV
ncbi:MAG: thioesterase domain-containing protein [Candidatus Azotimanducaceae bacterium]